MHIYCYGYKLCINWLVWILTWVQVDQEFYLVFYQAPKVSTTNGIKIHDMPSDRLGLSSFCCKLQLGSYQVPLTSKPSITFYCFKIHDTGQCSLFFIQSRTSSSLRRSQLSLFQPGPLPLHFSHLLPPPGPFPSAPFSCWLAGWPVDAPV